MLKTTVDNVELLGQDTDSLIVQLSDKGIIVHKMCDVYKSFEFSELNNTRHFYGQLMNYYEQEVYKSIFPSLSSFLNFNKKLPGPIFKEEHNGHRITEFVGLRPKMYCLIDEKNVVHSTAKGVPRNVVIMVREWTWRTLICTSVYLRQKRRKIQLSGLLQTPQQPGIRYKHEGTDQDSYDLHRHQAMDLGWQCAYTRIRSLPIEGHVKEKLFFYFGRGILENH